MSRALTRDGAATKEKKRHWILVDCLDPFFAWIPDQSLSLTFVIKDRGQASGTSVEDDRTEKADSSFVQNDRFGVSLAICIPMTDEACHSLSGE